MLSLILVIVGSIFVFLILFPFLALALARHNLFYTLVGEGEAKIVLHNKAFKKVIMRYAGFHLDKRFNVVQGSRREQLTKEEAKTKGLSWDGKKRRKDDKWWRKLWFKLMGGGLIFVGIWPFDEVYTYKFRWQALRKVGETVAHDELLDYVFVKSAVYFTELKEAETKGMVPLNIGLVLTIRIVNPYRALFRIHQWLEFAVSRIAPYIRQYIPAKEIEFEKLIGVSQGPNSKLFKFLGKSKKKFTAEKKNELRSQGISEKEIEEIERTGKGILWELWEVFGIDIQSIEFTSITTEGKIYEEAAAKKWSAEREKERIEITAQAEANAIETVSKAIEKHGQVGILTKTLDTINVASNKPGNWIFSVDWLKDLVKNVFNEKKGA